LLSSDDKNDIMALRCLALNDIYCSRRSRSTVNTRDVINDAHMDRTIAAAAATAKQQRQLR